MLSNIIVRMSVTGTETNSTISLQREPEQVLLHEPSLDHVMLSEGRTAHAETELSDDSVYLGSDLLPMETVSSDPKLVTLSGTV